MPHDFWRNTVVAFVLTALWDLILRLISTEVIPVPVIRDWAWVRVLRGYFELHTPLAAAMIAGACGAVAYALIALSWRMVVPRRLVTSELVYVAYAALVSGLIGLPMRYSGLFPHLVEHYYEPLGFLYSFCTDAFSGVVVLASMYSLKWMQPFLFRSSVSQWDKNVDVAFDAANTYLQNSGYLDDEERGFILDQNVSYWLPLDWLPRGWPIRQNELDMLINKYVRPLAEWARTTRQDGGPAFDAKAQQLNAALCTGRHLWNSGSS